MCNRLSLILKNCYHINEKLKWKGIKEKKRSKVGEWKRKQTLGLEAEVAMLDAIDESRMAQCNFDKNKKNMWEW